MTGNGIPLDWGRLEVPRQPLNLSLAIYQL